MTFGGIHPIRSLISCEGKAFHFWLDSKINNSIIPQGVARKIIAEEIVFDDRMIMNPNDPPIQRVNDSKLRGNFPGMEKRKCRKTQNCKQCSNKLAGKIDTLRSSKKKIKNEE